MSRAASLALSLLAACGSTPPAVEATPRPAAPRIGAAAEDPVELVHDPEAEAEARLAMDRCGVTDDFPALYPRSAEDEEYSSLLVARDAEGRLEIHYSEWGNGVDGGSGGFVELLDPGSCARLRYEWSRDSGRIREHASFVWRRRDRPTTAEIVRLSGARPAAGASPEHGFARMRVLTRCPGYDDEWRAIDPSRSWDVLGPLAEPQPWLRGPPAQSLRSFWPNALLGSVGALEEDETYDEEDAEDEASAERLDGVVVPETGRPRRVRSIGGLELFASEHDDRNGAVALALYDRARDRHRWIALTRGCVNGTRIEWRAEDGELLIGVTRSRHPAYRDADGVIVVDAASAQAFLLEQYEPPLAIPLDGSASRTRTPAQAAAWAALRARIRALAPSTP